jgi:Trk K+ transport system NAD-binding subunit
VLAVAVADIVLGLASEQPVGLVSWVWGYFGRLLVGAGVGTVAALMLSFILGRRGLIPAELTNLVSLAAVWAAFAGAEFLQSEAGIMAAVAMGLAMQRKAVPDERRLRRFKEQLTVLGISLLFVLLAANLPLEVVTAEGWPGVLTVLALMFVIRPISVAASLRGSPMNWRERLFVSSIAPRGIVAASVASLFALALEDAGISEGSRLLALTFLTIAMTVTIQGLLAAPLAKLLSLQSLEGRGAMVVGAGPLGLGIARALKQYGRPVVVIDRNGALVSRARIAGIDAVLGNALDESVLTQAGADSALTLVAVTTNSEINALAVHIAHEIFGVPLAYPALGHPSRGAGPQLLERVGGRVAFGRPVDVRSWEDGLERGEAEFFEYVVPNANGAAFTRALDLPEEFLVVGRVRNGVVEITSAEQRWRAGDKLVVVGRPNATAASAALDALVSRSWDHGDSQPSRVRSREQ